MINTYGRLDTAFGEQGDHVPNLRLDMYGRDLEDRTVGNPAAATPDGAPNAENYFAGEDLPNNSVPVSGTGALEASDVTVAAVEEVDSEDAAVDEVEIIEAPVEDAPVEEPVVEEPVEITPAPEEPAPKLTAAQKKAAKAAALAAAESDEV